MVSVLLRFLLVTGVSDDVGGGIGEVLTGWIVGASRAGEAAGVVGWVGVVNGVCNKEKSKLSRTQVYLPYVSELGLAWFLAEGLMVKSYA